MALNGVSDYTKKKQEELVNPTAAVISAQQKADDYTKNNNPENSKYGVVAEELLDKYLNRSDFDYDVNGDAIYKQYEDRYKKNANKAMKDTIAQSASYTGGYSNSWGETAGQQIYQDYMTELSDKIPELRQQAYNEYLAEGDMLLDKYGVAQGHYEDLIDRYYTERDYLDDKANEEYNQWLGERDYWDNVAANENSDYWTETQYEYQKNQDELAYDQNERSIVAQYAAADALTNGDYDGALRAYKNGGKNGLEVYLTENGYSGDNSELLIEYAVNNYSSASANRDENGNLIWNDDGTATWYIDGEYVTYKKGVNPYTANTNNDLLDDKGRYDEKNAFLNGYQPNNVKGNRLYDTGDEEEVYGRNQKVWETEDGTRYVWIGRDNKYITLNEYYNKYGK